MVKATALTVLLVSAVSLPVAAASAGPAPANNTVPQQVFDGMRETFLPNRAKGVHVRYQFDLSGPNGGLWWIEVNDGKYHIGRGRIRDANVTFVATDRDWVALSNGKLPGFWAYLSGRLKVHG